MVIYPTEARTERNHDKLHTYYTTQPKDKKDKDEHNKKLMFTALNGPSHSKERRGGVKQ